MVGCPSILAQRHPCCQLNLLLPTPPTQEVLVLLDGAAKACRTLQRQQQRCALQRRSCSMILPNGILLVPTPSIVLPTVTTRKVRSRKLWHALRARQSVATLVPLSIWVYGTPRAKE